MSSAFNILIAQAAEASKKYNDLLRSGKLQPVRDDLATACNGGGCAYDPLDPKTIYLVLPPTGYTPVPNGYSLASGKPSQWVWSGSGPQPSPAAPAPTGGISRADEQRILNATLVKLPPKTSYLSRNAKPLLIGGIAITVGIVGLLTLIK